MFAFTSLGMCVFLKFGDACGTVMILAFEPVLTGLRIMPPVDVPTPDKAEVILKVQLTVIH